MLCRHHNRDYREKPVFLFYQNWYDAGITKISDTLNQNQDFLKWHEFVLKFNLNVPFTIYCGPLNEVTKKIGKLILKTMIFPTSNTIPLSTPLEPFLFILLPVKPSSLLPLPKPKTLRHGFTENTIQKVYLTPFAVTNKAKIMFQYKVIHNMLPTRATPHQKAPCETYATRKSKRCIACQ